MLSVRGTILYSECSFSKIQNLELGNDHNLSSQYLIRLSACNNVLVGGNFSFNEVIDFNLYQVEDCRNIILANSYGSSLTAFTESTFTLPKIDIQSSSYVEFRRDSPSSFNIPVASDKAILQIDARSIVKVADTSFDFLPFAVGKYEFAPGSVLNRLDSSEVAFDDSSNVGEAIARLQDRVSNTIFESTGFLALQVSEAGDDANDGLTFPTAVRTLTRAKEIINSEYNCADSSVLILLADSVFNLDETLVIDSSWKCRSLTIIGQTLKWSDGVSSACILIDNNLEGTAGDSFVEPRGSTPLVILEDFTLEPPSTGNVMGLRVENGSRAIVNRVKFQQNNLFHLFVRHSKVYSYDGFSFDGEARTGIYLLKDSEINIFDAIAVNGTQNYSSEFLRVRDNSKFRCLTSTVFNTGATVTGKKYNFESQSEAYFKTDDPQYDTLEKLIPGDLAGTIAPNCIVNGDRLETSNAIAQLAVKAEQIPRIQSGIQQVSAAGTVQTNITFPQQFATVPNVQVTLITDGSGTFTDRGLVLEGEPTTTGFTVKGVGNVTALDKISWIAIAN